MKPIALVLFAVLALSFLPLLSSQQSQALSAVTFTSLDTLTSQSTSTFQRLYENSTNSIITLDANSTAAYFKSSYSISGDSVDSDSTTLSNTTYTVDSFPQNSPVDLSRYSVLFDGSTQYAQAGANTVFDVTTGDFSLWGLFYRVSDSGVAENIARKKLDETASTAGYFVRINTNDQLELYFADGTTQVTRTSAITIGLGGWYFWVASFDRDGNMVLYTYDVNSATLDTSSTSMAAASNSATNTQTFTVGRWSGGLFDFFPGRVDDLNVLLGTAVTAGQVNTLISNNAAITATSRFDFNEGIGTLANDIIGSSDLTLFNTPTWSSTVSTLSQSRLSHYITGRDTGSNVIGFAKLNTADLSEVDDEFFSSVYEPRDIVQSDDTLYVPATKSASNGDLILASATRQFGSFTQTTLYNGTAGVPVWGKYYEQTNTASDVGLDAATKTAAVEYASSSSSTLVGKSLDRISLYLSKFGAPTGTATIGVFDSSVNVVFTCGTQDVAALTGSAVEYVYDCDGSYVIQSGDRIGFKFTGGAGANYPKVHFQNVGTYDGTVSKAQWYTGSWTDLNSGNADLSGSFAQVQVKEAVYPGSPDTKYVFFESDDAVRVVKHTSSATLISTSMTHSNGSPFFITPLTDRILVQTTGGMYQLLTSTDAISSLYSGTQFPTRYAQTYSISPASQSFNSAAITIANSTYAITYVPSTAATARTGVLIQTASGGGSGTLTAYNPSKAYFLPTNDLVVDASSATATSWTIKDVGTKEQISVTGYSEYVGIDLAENTTEILALDVVKINCDNGNYLLEMQYVAVGSDADCNQWWTYDESGGSFPRRLPYTAIGEVVHTDTFTVYTFELSQGDPTVYQLTSTYDAKDVDYADFDSSGQLLQSYLFGQCYDVNVENKNTGASILFGNICANAATTKSISLASITIPENWLGVTWFHNATRDYTTETNNVIRYDVQKNQSPYNVSIHIVDHIKESLYSYDQWFNFTNRSNMTTIVQSGFLSNQTLYITAYENGVPIASDILGAKSYDIPDIFAPLGDMFGVPIVATVLVGVAAIWRKENAYFGIIVTLATAGILFTLGLFEVDPAIWAVIVVIGAVGVLIGVKRS